VTSSGLSYNTKGNRVNNSVLHHCPNLHSNPEANAGYCGPGSSCDAGVAKSGALTQSTITPIQYKVRSCNRRILIYKPHAYQESVLLAGTWTGMMECTESKGSAENVTVLIKAADWPQEAATVSITGLKGEQCCLGSYEATFYLDVNSQDFSVINTGWLENNCGYTNFTLSGAMPEPGQVFNTRFHTNISSLQNCTALSLTNKDYISLNISDFPEHFVVPKLGPILNQGTCGCCYAFATASALTDRINMTSPRNLIMQDTTSVMASPMFLLEHTLDYMGSNNEMLEEGMQPNYGGCAGGLPFDAFSFIAKYGAATCDADSNCQSGCYPYNDAEAYQFTTQSSESADGMFNCNGPMCDMGVSMGEFDMGGRRATLSGSQDALFWAEQHMFCARDKCRETDGTTTGPVRKCLQATAPECVADGIYSPLMSEVLIMEQVNNSGSVVATMEVFGNLRDYESWNPGNKSWEEAAVYKDTAGSELQGHHAIKIVGWGQTQSGEKYWHVANSWGAGWNGGGYFKIKRGDNFCEIESTVCYASPIDAGNTRKKIKDSAKKTNLHHLNTSLTKMPGAWMWQTDLTHATALKKQHASAVAAHAQTRRTSGTLSSDPADYTVTAARTQVVAGAKHHLVMSTVDSNGQSHTVHAIIHEDTEGNHNLLSTRTEAQEASAELTSQSPRGEDQGQENDLSLLWIVAASCAVAVIAGIMIGAIGATLLIRRNTLPRTVLMKELNEEDIKPEEPTALGSSVTRERQSSVQTIDVAPTSEHSVPPVKNSQVSQTVRI